MNMQFSLEDAVRLERALIQSARYYEREAKSRRYTGARFAPTRASYRSESKAQYALAKDVRRQIEEAGY